MKPTAALLEELRGIHLPPDPPLWPPAPGWWMAVLLAVAIILLAAPVARRALARMSRRRAAIAALARIEARAHVEPDAMVCARVAVLIRRVALERFDAATVAALTGEPWLAFLDRTGGAGASFSQVAPELLEAPYRRTADADVDTLLRLSAAWIREVM